MAKTIQFTCDFPGCTQVRGPSNHWFHVIPPGITDGFVIRALDIEYECSCALCMCSEAHVIQYISSHLADLHKEPELPVYVR